MGDTTKEIYDRMASDLVYPASKMPGSFTADNLKWHVFSVKSMNF